MVEEKKKEEKKQKTKAEADPKTAEAAEGKKAGKAGGVFCQQCENRNSKAEKAMGPGSRGWCKVHNKNVRRKEDASRCPDFKKKRYVAAVKRAAVEEEKAESEEAQMPMVVCADCAFVGRSERDSKGDDLGFYCEKRGAFMAGVKIPHQCEFFQASDKAKRRGKGGANNKPETADSSAAEQATAQS